VIDSHLTARYTHSDLKRRDQQVETVWYATEWH